MPETWFSEMKQKHVTPDEHEAVKSTRKNLSSTASTSWPVTLSPTQVTLSPTQVTMSPTQVTICTLQVVDSKSNTEASASSAVEQLMEEETQAAARAAAKKAKKLKQNPKKQQAQQPVSPSHGRVPDESDDNAKQSTCEPGHTQPKPLVLHPELQPEMPPAAFEGLSSAPTNSHLTERQSSSSAATVSAAALDLHSDSMCMSDSRLAFDQRTAGRSCSADDQVVRQLDSLQLTAAAMSPPCCASASSEEADLAPSGMDVTSELDKDAQFLQALFCCPITKVNRTYLPRYLAKVTLQLYCCLLSAMLWLRNSLRPHTLYRQKQESDIRPQHMIGTSFKSQQPHLNLHVACHRAWSACRW